MFRYWWWNLTNKIHYWKKLWFFANLYIYEYKNIKQDNDSETYLSDSNN